MTRIYLAGPMRGKPYFNFKAFDSAQNRLEILGYDVVSPAEMDREAGFDPFLIRDSEVNWHDPASLGFDLQAAIARDVAALLTCQEIYLLKGWECSRGARAEKATAEWMGLKVSYEHGENDILLEALELTTGDRNAQYGPPDQDFQRTAKMWSALKGVEFEAREVAMFMIALKLSRETHQKKRDSIVDIAGYARCMDNCSQKGNS